jgi:hypothetical protein
MARRHRVLLVSPPTTAAGEMPKSVRRMLAEIRGADIGRSARSKHAGATARP